MKERFIEMTDPISKAHLRIARPTDRLAAVTEFYRKGLGFVDLGHFEDHDGFDGVMLGHASTGYHLEFTSKSGHQVGNAPTQDNLMVFYLPDEIEWQEAVNRMETCAKPVPSFNPYWDKSGRTYEDPDGYRVVIQNASWPN